MSNSHVTTQRRRPRKRMFRRLNAVGDRLAQLAQRTDRCFKSHSVLADNSPVGRCLEILQREVRSICGTLAKICSVPATDDSSSPWSSSVGFAEFSSEPIASDDVGDVSSGRLVGSYRACGRQLGDLLQAAMADEEITIARYASALMCVAEKFIWLVQHHLDDPFSHRSANPV